MLFRPGIFNSTAGFPLNGKIECDVLTDEDWEWCASIIANSITFSSVIGVPRGGIKLAEKLQQYIDPKGWPLVVDDVWTSGKSMLSYMREMETAHAFVVFYRDFNQRPAWLGAIFDCCPAACRDASGWRYNG